MSLNILFNMFKVNDQPDTELTMFNDCLFVVICILLMSQVRPPGHHAGITQAMGFCLHNNAAVAALTAQVAGAKKVLIVDWVSSY